MTANSSLLQWLATFQLDDGTTLNFDDEAYYNLADGYLCARILNKISPKYFSDGWLEGIKPVGPNGRWPQRVSNLKRILQKIHDYTSDLQSSQFRPDIINPDVLVIAQNFDAGQINKLIQLLLFCAINCDDKEQYIEKIGHLPTQIKHDIKEAIEELMIKDSTTSATTKKEPNTSRLGSISSFNDSPESPHQGTRTSSPSYRSNTSSVNNTVSNLSPLKTPNDRMISRRDSSHSSQDNTFKLGDSQVDAFFTPNRNSSYSHNNRLQANESIEDIQRQLNAALMSREEKAQTCYELELKMKALQLEKEQLALENERLLSGQNQRLSVTPKKHADTIASKESHYQQVRSKDVSCRNQEIHDEENDSVNLANKQITKLHSELNRLKEDLIKVEAEREEYRLKASFLKDDLDRVTVKHNELRDRAEQAKRLQDELDEQRHISEKVVNYEAMVDNLIKKNNELKRELKTVEDKSASYFQKIVRLEEDNKQLSNAISRKDIYKERFQESQAKLSQETHRADKAETEVGRLMEKYSAAVRDNEKLYEATSQLKRQTSVSRTTLDQGPSDSFNKSVGDFDTTTLKSNIGLLKSDYPETRRSGSDLSPTSRLSLLEKIAQLEYENEVLHNKFNQKRETDNPVLSGLLESANSRCTKLEIDNKQLRKKLLMLENRLKDSSQTMIASTSALHLADSSSDNTQALLNRNEELQRLLFQKEQELLESEIKYKRNLQKAKDVIKTLNNSQSMNNSLHPSCMSSASSFNSSLQDETNVLKQQLKDKEERLIEKEREFYEYKKFKEIHERLIMTAFYGLVS